MTIGEVKRAFSSYSRKHMNEAREKATYDYILADLIARSMARIYSSSATYPEISEVYPTLFDSKEIQEKKVERKAELSALRFKQFAQSFNQRFKSKRKLFNFKTRYESKKYSFSRRRP